VRGVVAYFRRRVGDAELAADLTAETFAAALEGRRRYAPERGPAAAWLYGIARRQLVTFHRRGHVERRARRKRAAVRARIVEDHDYEQIAAAQSITEPAARQRVSRGLAALRARMRSQEQQP
jgi:DNA-directed RNA polymerase specialized sigma24 family protein